MTQMLSHYCHINNDIYMNFMEFQHKYLLYCIQDAGIINAVYIPTQDLPGTQYGGGMCASHSGCYTLSPTLSALWADWMT